MAKILVVENDAGLVDLISLRLESCGYNVLSASTVEDGINVYEKEKPNLVISDYRFKEDGKTGKDLYDYIRTKGKMPFILVSGKVREFKPDPGAFLMKPFDGKDLCEKIDALLNNKTISEK